MTITKIIPLALIIITGIIPCLPFVYTAEIFGFNGSVFFALTGFFSVCIALVIHQWLFEKGK
ncbi:hypothetical protein ACLIBH_09080 [Virgibacillus sp. W0430]|uniref:hypothetical protein n=1 Tax=Virgibacillus sp. W0430 TaxID=3391580 RepID=UPI003F46213E